MAELKIHQPDQVLYARLRWLLDRYTPMTIYEAIDDLQKENDIAGRRRRTAVTDKQRRLKLATAAIPRG